MAHIHKSFCRNCPAGCGIELQIEDNRIDALRGDRENPNSKGYFCVKGLSSMDLHNGQDRLLSSMMRGADGALTESSADEVLDDIGAKLAALIEQYGPRSVALYKGTGSYFNVLTLTSMTAWRHAMNSPNYFSPSTLDQSAKSVTAGRLGAFATGKRNIVNVDAMLLAGVNPLVSHSGFPGSPIPSTNPGNWLRSARQRGMKLIVVDPRETETARIADLHLPIKPGEDVALFAGLIHILLRDGGQDHEFCDRFLTSVDRLTEAVRPFTPDHVAARTGIDRARIEEAARLLCEAQRPSITSGTGPDMARRSNLAEHLIESLNALCGGYARAGEAILNRGLLYGTRPTAERAYPPSRKWESGPKCRTADAGFISGEFPTSLLPDEILTPGEDKIRALIVIGGNPAAALGQPGLTQSALRDLDLLVTVDMRWTETARLSSHVVAVKTPYECHDITGFLDNFFLYPFAQYVAPALTAPAGLIEDWEFFWGLAKRLGRQLVIKPPSLFLPYEFQQKALPLDLEEKPSSLDLIKWLASHGRYSFDEIAAHPSGFAPVEEEVIITAAAEDDGGRLDLCPPDIAEEITEALNDEESTSRYLLTVRRQLETMNSAFTNADRTRRRFPLNFAFMNPGDMDRDAIADGDRVRLASAHGAVVATAKADRTMRSGTVAVPHLWGVIDPALDPDGEQGTHIGHLISITEQRQTINFMPVQTGIPIDVSRAAAD